MSTDHEQLAAFLAGFGGIDFDELARDPQALSAREFGVTLRRWSRGSHRHGPVGRARLEQAFVRVVVQWIERAPSSRIHAAAHSEIERALFPGAGGLESLRAAWATAVRAHRDDPRVLANAARAFRGDGSHAARTLLEQARALAVDDPSLVEHLASELAIEARDIDGRVDDPDLARSALADFERAADRFEALGSSTHSTSSLASAAELAIDLGELDRAHALARRLLDFVEREGLSTRRSRAHFDAHAALGRVALRRGDVDAAERHLLEAAHLDGDESLTTFGPSTELAQELLDVGRRAAVREFLERCRVFSNHDHGRIDAWLAALDRGDADPFAPF